VTAGAARIGTAPFLLPQQPAAHFPAPSNSIVLPLSGMWTGTLTAFLKVSVLVPAITLPSLVPTSLACEAMTEAGVRAYEENKGRSGVYAYENEPRTLTRAETAQFRRNKAAWADWEKRPPGYRKVALNWVTTAKKTETRARRLATLIRDSAAGRRIGPLTNNKR